MFNTFFQTFKYLELNFITKDLNIIEEIMIQEKKILVQNSCDIHLSSEVWTSPL